MGVEFFWNFKSRDAQTVKIIYQDTLLILLQQGYKKRDHNQAASSARHIDYYLYEELWVAILFNLLTEKVTINVFSFQSGNLYCIYFPSRGILCLKKISWIILSKDFHHLYPTPHYSFCLLDWMWFFCLLGWGREKESVCMCWGVCVCMHIGGWVVLKYYKMFYSQLNLRLKIYWN